MSETTPLDVIRGQIVAARADLDGYAPAGLGWFDRATATAQLVIPWLCGVAAEACAFCEDVYNSPDQLRAAWAALKPRLVDPQVAERIDFYLGREQVLIKEIAGDVVSRVSTDFLMADGVGRRLAANGRSDYPDLYVADLDYVGLPRHVRRRGADEGSWAALKGNPGRPVRVPDGIEIKTCRNSSRVDCHYPHAGLHVAL